MLFTDANKLLEPGYSSLETGYYRLIDGQIVVAVLTSMSKCTGEMVDWWYGYLDDTKKYRKWCPADHIDLKPGESRDKGCFVNTSLFVKWRMEGIIKNNEIRFHHPSDFLNSFDPLMNPQNTVICGNVYSPEKVLESRFIHCVRNTDFGCEMRSRIWLINADDDLAINVMRHCLNEMGNLAAFLPGLFHDRDDEAPDSESFKTR